MIKVGDEVIAVKDCPQGRYKKWDRFKVTQTVDNFNGGMFHVGGNHTHSLFPFKDFYPVRRVKPL